MGEWKQLEGLLGGLATPSPSQFHPTTVETWAKRSDGLIRQALLLDQEDAFSVGEVVFLARALVQATLPHSDPKENEFVRENGHFTLSILPPKVLGPPYGRYPRLVLGYLSTEGVRRKTRHVELNHHFSRFRSSRGIAPARPFSSREPKRCNSA